MKAGVLELLVLTDEELLTLASAIAERAGPAPGRPALAAPRLSGTPPAQLEMHLAHNSAALRSIATRERHRKPYLVRSRA